MFVNHKPKRSITSSLPFEQIFTAAATFAMDSNKNDNDDLYGDLDLSLDTKKDREPRIAKGHRPSDDSQQQLRKQLQLLQEENLRLKRNIGTLFRTAKHEIQRKDARIEELQRELDKRQS